MRPNLLSPLLLTLGLGLMQCSAPGPIETEVDLPKKSGEGSSQEVIAIVGTNDIHGGLFPQSLKTRESDKRASIEYEAGGAAYLASYLRVLRDEWGDRLLWLDGGDEFQGTLESNSERGVGMVDFFNLLGLNGAAIGNHEFDWGLAVLEARLKQAQFPYLAANIFTRSTRTRAELPNTRASMLYSVGRAKVGVIGLSTLDTPKTTRPENVRDYLFSELAPLVLSEAKKLRDAGAQAVLVVAHVGLKCPRNSTGPHYALRRIEDNPGACDPREEMVRLLEALPSGTVDGVVSGHSHTIVHHWINGVPVIQAGAFGRYLNVIYLKVDLARGRVAPEATRIEGPIPVCPKVFRNQRDCNGDAPTPPAGRGALVTPTFHGRTIQADEPTQALLAPLSDRMSEIRDRVVGHAPQAIDHKRQGGESPLGNLVADSMREVMNADFALINGGGIRTSLEAGKITYGAVFRMLPFDNTIVTVDVTPAELRRILRVAMSGARSWASVSGLKLTLLDDLHNAKGEDLDGDGKVETWEFNMLLDVRDAQGNPLKANQRYKLATIDFLTSGGDDLAWPMAQIPKERFHLEGGPILRETFADYLKLHDPLVAPHAPRLNLVKKLTQGRTRRSVKKRSPR